MESETKRFFLFIAYAMAVTAGWMLLNVYVGMYKGWVYSDVELWKRVVFWVLVLISGGVAVKLIINKYKTLQP